MAWLKVVVRLVDGGEQDLMVDESVVPKARALQSRGVSGKEIIDTLITDDWGPPPVSITISGRDSAGRSVELVIPYE